MRRIFLAVAAISILAACNNNKPQAEDHSQHNHDAVPAAQTTVAAPVNAAEAPVMTFEKESYDFGVVTAGEKVKYEFKFKNTGKTPLIITNAEASCGCTVPEFPREPVVPGGEGTIRVVFDSAGRTGMQNKLITLTSNAVPATTELHLIGDVKEAK
ncbi:MAG TPA: DUF1573 domain-containing protein [Sphingobacteriaceae bacterium]